jgi:hypothetical protein
VGNGGLIREVLIPSKLATKLEQVPMHKITEWLKRYDRFDVLLLLLLVQVCMRAWGLFNQPIGKP